MAKKDIIKKVGGFSLKEKTSSVIDETALVKSVNHVLPDVNGNVNLNIPSTSPTTPTVSANGVSLDTTLSMVRFYLKLGESNSALKTYTDETIASLKGVKDFAKLGTGLFIHWGVYAVPAGVYTGVKVDTASSTIASKTTTNYNTEWIMRDLGIPKDIYKSYESEFNTTNWDPEEIATLAENAGMGYIVITIKHHEGFSLYPTNYGNWDVRTAGTPEAPCSLTLIDDLKTACENHGLKFGIYYSQYWDWMAEGGFGLNHGSKWCSTDLYTEALHIAYCNRAVLLLKEIMEKYDPYVLWYDPGTNYGSTYINIFKQGEFDYYPHVITNDRLDYNRAYGDFGTGERTIYLRDTLKYGESCFTMNNTWGYSINNENSYFGIERIFKEFMIYSLSYGQNCLMNIGPKADGSIPAKLVEALQLMLAFSLAYGSFRNYKRICVNSRPKFGFQLAFDNNILCYFVFANNTVPSTVTIDSISTDNLESVEILTPGTNSSSVINTNSVTINGLALDTTTKIGVVKLKYSMLPELPDANLLSLNEVLPARTFPIKNNMTYNFSTFVYTMAPNKNISCSTDFIWNSATGNYNIEELFSNGETNTATVTLTIKDLTTNASTVVTLTNNANSSSDAISLVNGRKYTITHTLSGTGTASYTFLGIKFIPTATVVAPESVTINSTTTTLGVGETTTLTATVSPSGASLSVTWTSSAPLIASVNSATGVVTALSAGTATITATTADGSKYNYISLTIEESDTPVTPPDVDDTDEETYDYKFEALSLDGSDTLGEVALDASGNNILLFSDELQNWTLFGYAHNSVNTGQTDNNATLYLCVVDASPWSGLRIDANNTGYALGSAERAPLIPRMYAGVDKYISTVTGAISGSKPTIEPTGDVKPICISRDGTTYKYSLDGINWTTFPEFTASEIERLKTAILTVGFDYKRASGAMTTTKYRKLITDEPCCVAIKYLSVYPFTALYAKYPVTSTEEPTEPDEPIEEPTENLVLVDMGNSGMTITNVTIDSEAITSSTVNIADDSNKVEWLKNVTNE